MPLEVSILLHSSTSILTLLEQCYHHTDKMVISFEQQKLRHITQFVKKEKEKEKWMLFTSIKKKKKTNTIFFITLASNKCHFYLISINRLRVLLY